jgi:hypothetical protein
VIGECVSDHLDRVRWRLLLKNLLPFLSSVSI